MALDVGDVRIGIAVSDMLKMIANPIETYRTRGQENDVRYIADIAKTQEAELIVIGLPLKMDGSESEQTAKTRLFAGALAEVCDVPQIFQDERLSSITAENILIEADMRREKRKQVIDRVAAGIILQSYLDRKR